jgi:hypothetical protein
MSIVDDMFYELFKITDLYRSGLEEALDQDLARNLVKTLVAMSSLSSAHVELIYCQLQGGFGGFDDDFFKGGFGAGPQKSEKLDPFPGAPSVSYPSVRVSPLDFFAHRTSFPQFLGHVKLQKLQFCKVEELHLVPSVPAQEEVEAALSVFQILCCSALRLAQG